MLSTVDEKPHCGERQSWSSGMYLLASSIRRFSVSFCSTSPRFSSVAWLVVAAVCAAWSIHERRPYGFAGHGSPDKVASEFVTNGTALEPSLVMMIIALGAAAVAGTRRRGLGGGADVVLVLVAVVSVDRDRRRADLRPGLPAGYPATSIEAIAAATGVSARTFYVVYGSKRNVLFALLARMAPRGAAGELEAELAAAAGEPRRQLELTVDYILGIYTGGSDLLSTIRAAGATEPDLAAVAREGDHRLRTNEKSLVRAWAHHNVLQPDLSIDDATDTFWALTSPDLHHLLVDQRHWSRKCYRTWLVDTLAAQLLHPSKTHARADGMRNTAPRKRRTPLIVLCEGGGVLAGELLVGSRRPAEVLVDGFGDAAGPAGADVRHHLHHRFREPFGRAACTQRGAYGVGGHVLVANRPSRRA